MNLSVAKVINFCKEWGWITLGLALYACAWNVFVLPHGFVGGGFGGISAMLYYLTDIPISAWYLGANVILCVIAVIVMGREFSVKTVFGILILTFFLAVIPSPGTPLDDPEALRAKLITLFNIPNVPIISDKLLSGIMGGIIGGAGIATYLLHGASTGGSDIIVLIVSKYKNVSWGKIYLIFDACVIASSFFMPEGSIEKVAYGYVFMGVSAYAVDMISNGRRQSVQMFIFTTKYREIADEIIHHHHRGATLIQSIGWYTKQHNKTIYLVARKRECQDIFRTVKAIDDKAFIAVSNVMSVFGIGFDAIKAGFHKAKAAGEDAAAGDIQGGPIPEDHAVPQPIDAPSERPVNSDVLHDELEIQEHIKENTYAKYNPHWETPASEILSIPEMPMIPPEVSNDDVKQYISSEDLPKTSR